MSSLFLVFDDIGTTRIPHLEPAEYGAFSELISIPLQPLLQAA